MLGGRLCGKSVSSLRVHQYWLGSAPDALADRATALRKDREAEDGILNCTRRMKKNLWNAYESLINLIREYLVYTGKSGMHAVIKFGGKTPDASWIIRP
jgi:hypothetical protein